MNEETIYCFYCEAYQRLIIDYPVNIGINNIQNILTPRCEIHFQYRCDTCDSDMHFNGISFCIDCKKFTCIDCGEVNKIDNEFLTYDYYYDIACTECNKSNSSLDFAEFNLTHPMQMGIIRPEGNIVVWVPMNLEYPTGVGSISGETRILAHAIENQEIDKVNDKNLDYKILPHLEELLEPSSSDTILEISCNNGKITKEIASCGAILHVIGTDKLLKSTIEAEERSAHGIVYHQLDISNLLSKFKENQFDKIYTLSNLVSFSDIYKILKINGVFVFSIPHPYYAKYIKLNLPVDSKRKEDQVKVLLSDDLNIEQNKVSITGYVNKLISNGFVIEKMVESTDDNPIIIFKVRK